MKYLKTYESFRNYKMKSEFEQEEPVNEIFGAIGRLFSSMFNKVGQLIRKTKGGAEVDAIYNKYLTKLGEEFKKTAGVSLNILAAEKQAELDAKGKEKTPSKEAAGKEAAGKDSSGDKGQPQKESFLIKEAEAQTAGKAGQKEGQSQAQAEEEPGDANTKMTPETLKQKKAVLDQILNKIKSMALKEMDAVLVKNGGAAKNPQLSIIIQAKKDQFDLDFMNAQIKFLEESGDKTMIPNLVKQRDAITKKIEKTYKSMSTAKPVEYKPGEEVIYLLKGKTKDDWDKLTDDEKAKPTEGKAKDIVGVREIDNINGDKFTLLNSDGKPNIFKTGNEILGKPKDAQKSSEKVEFKIGDTVTYKKKDGTENKGEVMQIDGENVQLKTEKNKGGFSIKASQITGLAGIEGEGEEGQAQKAQGQGQKEGEEGQAQKAQGQGQGQAQKAQGQGQDKGK